jgi:hypothetical protein
MFCATFSGKCSTWAVIRGGNVTMKAAKKVLVLLAVGVLLFSLHSQAYAGQGGAESITLVLDRAVMPVSIYHAGLFWTEPETVTVHNFMIRDYLGRPIDGFVIQTASARTKVPIRNVREIQQAGWISKNTDDIEGIEYVVPVHMVLTDGTELDTLMNADFGTIEGKTEDGKFFLGDPHTVTYLAFNRPGVIKRVITPTQPSPLDEDGDGIPDDADLCPDTPAGVPVDEFGCPLDSDGDGVPDYLDRCPDTPAEAIVDENGCPIDSDGDGVPDYKDRCPETPVGATVNSIGCWVLRGINFDYNKWDIKPQFVNVLDKNVEVLKQNSNLKIEVQGHTDSIASETYNQMLSEKRADSAKAYLTSQGIDSGRISTRGFGESKPVASNDTPEGRSENRRIEIKILSR